MFTPRAGVAAEKIFSFRHSRHFGDSHISPARGGGVEKIFLRFEFCGSFCRLLIFLVSEERVPKQLKHISIVGKKQAMWVQHRYSVLQVFVTV